MRTKDNMKNEFKWSKNRFEPSHYSYSLNGKDIAEIYPRETKDGRIQWGFWIDRLSGHKEINSDNSKTYYEKYTMNSTYPKRKDIKKKIEEVISTILSEHANKSI